jgi:hypothetical protein
MKMNRATISACVVIAFVIGFGAAFAKDSLESLSASGLLYVGSRKQEGFDRMFDQLAHLGTIEYAAANCAGRHDVHAVLMNESDILTLLAEGNKQTDSLSLPLAAAQARLAARELLATGAQSRGKTYSSLAERARSLAAAAGWKDSSETHLREIIEALDRDHCPPPSATGAISQ